MVRQRILTADHRTIWRHLRRNPSDTSLRRAGEHYGAGMAPQPFARMQPYGIEHLSMLILALLCAVVLVRWARRSPEVRVLASLRLAGWIMLVNSVLWTVWGMLPWSWNLHESLPLHYSDALRFVAPIALITRAPWAIAVSYFWGLTLNLQAVLTPDVNYFIWPPLEFTEYWFAHLSALLVPIVLTWGLGWRPTWRGGGLAYAVTLGWAALALGVNAATGANYGYLSRAPQGPSLLDVLGPWPQYLLAEALLVAAVWAAMTLPWTLIDARRGTPTTPGTRLLRRPVSRVGTGIAPDAPRALDW